MEYRYYRELRHNYLVFQDKTKEGEDRYQIKIAESGRIKGLIPCAERSINGEKFFYYEIGSMQTLRDRYQVNGMNSMEVRGLLRSVKELLENLSDFLMGEEGLVFNSRNIYTDLSTGEFKMIFCPFFDEQKSFSDFAIELLELVDESDEKATEMVYRLCDQSAGKGDFIYEILEYALGDESEAGDNGSSFPGEDIGWDDQVYEEVAKDDEDYKEQDENKKSDTGRLKRAGKRLGGKIQLLFALMFALVVGAMVYIRTHFILSGQENMLSILVMLVSAITGVVSMVGGFRELKGINAPAKEDEDEGGEDQNYDEMEDYDHEGDRGYDEKVYINVNRSLYRSPLKVTGNFGTAGTEMECGETMVLDQERTGELALFSRNLDKTVRIALDALPLTIGKMEGCVDKVLRDSSISRIHCRISRDGEKIAIHDLGSTNGTYRNGERLRPQEKVYIEEGDEIRIGRVCFDCR